MKKLASHGIIYEREKEDYTMGKSAERIRLSKEEKDRLLAITHQGTVEARVYIRAKILLLKNDSEPNQYIANRLDITAPTVSLCLKKYKEGGIDAALKDESGRGRKAEIFDDAKAWVVNIACQKPTAFGFAAELWYPTSLTKYVNAKAREAGFPRLETATVTTIRKILREVNLNPHKVKYYCEKRDPDFDKKMHDVLVIYKQIEMQFDEEGNLLPFKEDEPITHTISYDEKPGIQAIATTSDDKLPIPGTKKNGCIYRDYEYERLGTVSLLAGIDLLTGDAIPLVSDTHKSSDFIRFLNILNSRYPEGDKIRIILDNHSAHTSRETQEFLNTIPGRFEFVFTPTHGSWLNMIEGFFSKMTRQMLTGIRVESKDELSNRIYQYFNEINKVPVPYKWKYKMDSINLAEENINNIVYEIVNAKAARVEDKEKRAPLRKNSFPKEKN